MNRYSDILLKCASYYKICVSSQFDKNKFNSLPAFSPYGDRSFIISKEREKYLSQFTYINGGSSRYSYILSSKKTLKVAKYKGGLIQNREEYKILSSNTSNFLPKVYDHANDYSWIIVELVRPFDYSGEIYSLTGINDDDFFLMMHAWTDFTSYKDIIKNQINNLNQNIEEAKLDKYDISSLIKERDRWISYLNNSFLNELAQFFNKTNVKPSEFGFPFNLGKSSSGHLVLLDLGRINNL